MREKFTVYNLLWSYQAKRSGQFTIFSLFVLILLSAFCILHSPQAKATNLSSDSYKIQMGNLNMGAGLPSSDSYKLGVTGGQTAPGLYTSTGYKVMAGFWYIKTIIPFAFTISDLTIDFGTLTAGTPSTATNKLSVSAGGAGGYQVTAIENDALKTLGSTARIPDTACNGGAETCDEENAAPWTDNSKYGFGYNMTGNDIPSTFVDSTYFRPFPSDADNESAAIVMEYVGKNRVATVTYKVNISGSQEAGNYQNYIIFVATPKY